MDTSRPITVLITGAYGLIGNIVYARLAVQSEAYTVYGTARLGEAEQRAKMMNFTQIPAQKLHMADLMDFAALQRAVTGMDVVIHLAADASGRKGWDSLLHNNIIGTHNVFEASRIAGVKRVVFASTNQTVFGYRDTEPYASMFAGHFNDLSPKAVRPITPTQPARPINQYAASKLLGESLAHVYAHAFGMSCIVVRIGWVTPNDQLPHENARILWCSQRDIAHLIECCVSAPERVRFDIFFGQSDNLYNLVDIQHTRDVLGYTPQDSAEERLAQNLHGTLWPEWASVAEKDRDR
jgi:nucleoside-diphosphate-sugar epimerase